MDLTNIKPCVECAKWGKCALWRNADQMAWIRIRKAIVKGEDCFEEVDDG